jgi:hypothetical protein
LALLYFFAALLGIVLFAVIVNRVTGTKASYLETLQLDLGEREIWRDSAADFALLPRTGLAVSISFPRLRRHCVLWTQRRVVISVRALGSSKHMITHQVVFERELGANQGAREAAGQFSGGFYGRGFSTLISKPPVFKQVNDKDCVCFVPNEASGATLNVLEAYLFADSLAQLQARLATG